MAFLLDTNVLSEAVKESSHAGVRHWLGELAPTAAYLSVLTLGEIRRGVALMDPGRRRTDLQRWLEYDLPDRFRGRVLPVNEAAAAAWAEMDADARREGRPLPVIDGLLLATARANRLTFVTRNERDCADRGVAVLNPWRV